MEKNKLKDFQRKTLLLTFKTAFSCGLISLIVILRIYRVPDMTFKWFPFFKIYVYNVIYMPFGKYTVFIFFKFRLKLEISMNNVKQYFALHL